MLRFLPEDVDLGVIGDGFEGDMRGAFIDKAVAHVLMGGRVRLNLARYRLLLGSAISAVSKQKIGIFGRHQPRAGERQRNSACVDRNPATSPLFGDIGGSARTTGGVEHKVTRVSRH